MDAVIENVKNSFEVGVRKVLIAGPKRGSLTIQSNKNKSKVSPRVFNTSLCEICQQERSNVPYLVRDVCNFIQEKHVNAEGIFRISSSSIQVTKLRKAFEERGFNNENQRSVCAEAAADGHTAANVLKQFLRHLPEPLVPSEVLKIAQESKCLSDEAFASKVRSALSSISEPHRDTLQYILTFLQPIMRNPENRMNVTGLAVVFGPNVFHIPTGAEGLEIQALANHTFERLLLTTDVICDIKDDQGYLNMTQSPPSPPAKPARVAPPVPLQARPLPPPPVPDHGRISDVTVPAITSSPSVPLRSKSLTHRLASGDSIDSNLFTSESLSEHSDTEGMTSDLLEQNQILHNNRALVEEAISDVVRKHLFTAESSGSCQEDDVLHDHNDGMMTSSLLPSLTHDRNSGPKRRKPSRKHRRSFEEFLPIDDVNHENFFPIPVPRKSALEIPDTQQNVQTELMPVELQTPPLCEAPPPPSSPAQALTKTVETSSNSKLFFENVFDEEKRYVDGITEVVPPLDLSGVISSDEVRPKPLPRREKDSPSRVKRRKRKRSKSSPIQVKTPPTPLSDPITIPSSNSTDRLFISGGPASSASPPEGSLKWRDAWSTDEEGISTMVAMENALKHSKRHVPDKREDNIELPPSSPENHVLAVHSSKRRLQRRHHHHSNRLSRGSPDIGSPPSQKEDDYSHLVVSLDKIQTALRSNRQEEGRPEDLTLMTREQIRSEKLAMQRELLKHEEKYGRPAKKVEKDIMRGVYERYRTVKRLLADSLAPPFNIPFTQTLDDVRKDDYDLARSEAVDEFAITRTLPPSNFDNNDIEGSVSDSGLEVGVSISGDLGIAELRRQQKEAKGQRKRLRRKLKAFEKEIEQQYDRKITHADKVVMATEYQELKALKAKIRLLEALINKKNLS